MSKFPSENDLKNFNDKFKDGIASKPLSKDASKVDRLKFKLCEKFIIYKNRNKITQRALDEEIGIIESLVSKIIHYHTDKFTVDRLIGYLEKIHPEFDLKIIVAA